MDGHKSSEDYLEAILILSQSHEKVRSIDVVNFLNFSKPSVSIAMKKLREKNYIQVMGDGSLLLTDSGLQIASSILERHNFFSDLLISLGVNKQTAIEDACKIEHDISDESFSALKKLSNKNL